MVVNRSPQCRQPLQIVGTGDQGPFKIDFPQAAQQELTEAEGLLDDPEHRLDCLFSEFVELSTSLGL